LDGLAETLSAHSKRYEYEYDDRYDAAAVRKESFSL
jgi:hypothetical protein